MSILSDVVCGHSDPLSSLSRTTIEELGFSFADALNTACGLADLSQALKRGSLCSLPFCSTVEGEAMGANIIMGDETAGPRAAINPHWKWQEPLVFPAVDFSQGRLGAVLAACKLLKQRGEQVVLEICGPVTVLGCLMDLGAFFKTWRKHPEWVAQAMDKIMHFQLRYMELAVAAGVDLLCYADPAGSYSILGPKFSEELMHKYVLPMLRATLARQENPHGLHLCPKTVHILMKCGFAQWYLVDVGPVTDYAQGCLLAARKVPFMGEACLKNTAYLPVNGQIKSIKLLECKV